MYEAVYEAAWTELDGDGEVRDFATAAQAWQWLAEQLRLFGPSWPTLAPRRWAIEQTARRMQTRDKPGNVRYGPCVIFRVKPVTSPH